MNKKLLIGIAAAVVIAGGIVAVVVLKGKGGDETPTKDVDTYSIESATGNGKVNFELAKGMGYAPVESTAKGSLILTNEADGTKMTFYYKHTDKKSIIGGEQSYAGSYYDYNEYQVNGHEACSVKKNKQEDGTPWRVEFNMVLNESASDNRFDGVAIYFENTKSGDEAVNLGQLFAKEDVRQMLESMTYIAE